MAAASAADFTGLAEQETPHPAHVEVVHIRFVDLLKRVAFADDAAVQTRRFEYRAQGQDKGFRVGDSGF
jgi:hypothetical protein